MADHWKTLANRLGTPGIDEPELEEQPKKEKAPEAHSSASAAPHAEPESPQSMEKTSLEKTHSRPSQPPPEPIAAPAKPAKRKSSWEALANLFNVSVDRSSEAPEQEERPQPAAEREPEEDFSRSARSAPPNKNLALFEEPADPNAALDSMFADAPRQKLTSEGGGWGKPKRMVDDLAWNEVDDEPVDEAVTDEAVAAEDDDDAEPSGEDPAPRGRRRRRRGRRGRGRDDDATPKLAASDAVDEDDADAIGPLSWKHDLLDVESAGPWAEPDSFESDGFEAAVETDDFETVDEQLDDELDDKLDQSFNDDSGEEGEVVRRSNRRRRRGRSRDDAPRSSEPAQSEGARRESSRSTESSREPGHRQPSSREGGSSSRDDAPRRSASTPDRARRPAAPRPASKAPRRDFEDDFLEPIEEIDVVADEAPTAESERSSTNRRRRGRKPVDSPARTGAEEAGSIDDEMDALGDEEEGMSAAQKHRNIPTWTDSLESIIQANTENHKRNEGRGGPRGGGRSRGRR